MTKPSVLLLRSPVSIIPIVASMLGVLSLLSSACSAVRAPRPAPAAVLPSTLPVESIPQTRPAPGTGRVVLDVVDGPSDLQIKLSPPLTPSGAVEGGAFSYGQWQHLCRTPCVVDLPAGRHDLSIRVQHGNRGGDSDILVVEPEQVTAYRRAITIRKSSYIKSYAGYTLLSIGIPVLLTGLLLMPADVDTSAALIVTGFGAAGTIGGGYLLREGIPHRYPGATTNWRLTGPGGSR